MMLAFSCDTLKAITLDRSGTGHPPDYYTCTQVKLIKAQGAHYANDPGTNQFYIQMTGLCAVHPGEGLAGWTPVEWKKVNVYGSYWYNHNNPYSAQNAKETVKVDGKTVFEAKLACSVNPWAHGPYVGGSTCSTTSEPKNETGAVVHGPYPLSAKYMDYTTQSAIAKAEDWTSPEEELSDWDPYEQTGGTPGVTIVKPSNLELINQATNYYNFVIEKNSGFPDPPWIKFQFEHLEETPEMVGDIKLPDTYSHWWQPFNTTTLPGYVSPIPIGISAGLFSNSTGQFRVRVRAYQAFPNKNEIGGWTPWRTFCIGQSDESCKSGTFEFGKLAKASEALKSLEKFSLLLDEVTQFSPAEKSVKKRNFFNELGTKEEKRLSKHLQKQPNMDKMSNRETTLPPKFIPNLPGIALSVVSSKDDDNILRITFENKTEHQLNKQLIEIKGPRNDSAIWHDTLSFDPGKTALNIDHDDMNLKFQPKGKRKYQVLSNNKKIGTVLITHELQIRQIGKQSRTTLKHQDSSKIQRAKLFLPPRLDIRLSLRNKNLKDGDKADILATVENKGKGVLKETEMYSLQCTPKCPFSKTKDKLNRELEPGKQFSFHLTSQPLDDGDYAVSMKTQFGSSNKLKFDVDALRIRQRSSTETRRTHEAIPPEAIHRRHFQ